MATTVIGNSSVIQITINGVVRKTINKRLVNLSVDGDYLNIIRNGLYDARLLYTDVTNPATGSAELLRTAIKNILIS